MNNYELQLSFFDTKFVGAAIFISPLARHCYCACISHLHWNGPPCRHVFGLRPVIGYIESTVLPSSNGLISPTT